MFLGCNLVEKCCEVIEVVYLVVVEVMIVINYDDVDVVCKVLFEVFKIYFVDVGWKVGLVGVMVDLFVGCMCSLVNKFVVVCSCLDDMFLFKDDKNYFCLYVLYWISEVFKDCKVLLFLWDLVEDFRFDYILVDLIL